MKKNGNTYTDEFKFTVVQEYINSDLSQQFLMEKYSIKGKGCITNWMRKFGLKEEYIKTSNITSLSMAKGNKKSPEELALEKKVKELEKALEYEKLRSLALDTMIDVAEDKLNITIRKKSGAKQQHNCARKNHKLELGLYADCLAIVDKPTISQKTEILRKY